MTRVKRTMRSTLKTRKAMWMKKASPCSAGFARTSSRCQWRPSATITSVRNAPCNITLLTPIALFARNLPTAYSMRLLNYKLSLRKWRNSEKKKPMRRSILMKRVRITQKPQRLKLITGRNTNSMTILKKEYCPKKIKNCSKNSCRKTRKRKSRSTNPPLAGTSPESN